jgi:DHA1 family bicyclomycin/chloramphenicol resistance-like MFS transporter
MTATSCEATCRKDTAGHPDSRDPRSRTLSLPLLLTLALLAAAAPVATDLYLPAFPRIAAALGTGAAGVQVSLTTFLAGAALGQLIFGPLSDRYGRAPIVHLGALAFVVTSAAAALAPGAGFLAGVRFAQGLAGSAGMVVGRAIITDLATTRQQADRAFNLMMTVVGIAPIIAPWLGSVLIGPLDWRGVLWAVAAVALATLASALAWVRETRPGTSHAPSGSHPWQALRSRPFLGNALAFSLAFAVMMAYISASPFLFQNLLGLSVVQYGLLFAAIALVLTATGLASSHLSARIPSRRLLGLGLGTLVAACLVLVLLEVLGVRPIWMLAPIAGAVGSLGLVLGNATSAALAAVPGATGAGSAVLGALQFGFGALVAPLVGLGGGRSAWPLAITMALAALLAGLAFLTAGEGERPALAPMEV